MEEMIVFLLLPTFFIGVLITTLYVIWLIVVRRMQELLSKRD